ncbi:type IV pilus modification PilV family protein [Cellulomonas sp. P5_C5]
MRTLRERLAQARDEDGVSLVEVLMAMLIFAIVSTGLIFTMLSVLSLGRDSRARQVAANLAAEDIDRTREEKSIFELQDKSYTRDLNGDTFHVDRETSWVSDPDLEFECGAGGGALRYKRVNITITWDGMRDGTEPVRADTVLDAKDRINDPTRSTLLISVLNGEGLGSQGVSVVAQPTTMAGVAVGAALPAVTTDAEGCAYVLKAPPGYYKVTISRAGYVDINQATSPSVMLSVAANATASAAFAYDRAATYTLRFGTNVAPLAPSVPAASMPATFDSTYGPKNPVVSSGTGTPRTYSMFPISSGYSIFAGTCSLATLNNGPADPANWAGGVRQPEAAASPGGAVTVDVPMGIVNLAVGPLSVTNGFVKAVPVDAPTSSDAAGCPTGTPLTFSSAVLNASGNATIALPYGFWKLYRGNSTTQTTAITSAQVVPVTGGAIHPDSTVELDPRSPLWEGP